VEGLSADELQFIAEFLGACVLDSSGKPCVSRAQWAERITRYHEASLGSSGADREHKMILLLEFLCQCRGSNSAVSDGRSQLSALGTQIGGRVADALN
jgi:hypothetical protein